MQRRSPVVGDILHTCQCMTLTGIAAILTTFSKRTESSGPVPRSVPYMEIRFEGAAIATAALNRLLWKLSQGIPESVYSKYPRLSAEAVQAAVEDFLSSLA